jgi:Xaa-Pro dipeptidase
MYTNRLKRLQDEIIAQGLDGMALMPGPNMTYITGLHTHVSERPILLFVPADDDPSIIIPTLEAMKAEQAGIPPANIFHWNDDQGYTEAFQAACAHLELTDYVLGVESLHMRVLERDLLQRYAPGVQFTHGDNVIAKLRITKDENELAAMAKAVAVAETAIERLIPRIKVGQTEKQLAAMLSQEMMNAGADSIAFIIVQGGPNTASPHGVPTDRPIQNGDLLLFDWGAVVDDYPSDITRTFAVGEISRELQYIYDVVKAANHQGKAVAKYGATGQDVDRAARGVIDDAGYGEYFIHRTGHGLGLEVHEPPYMMEANEEPMAIGTVFTVEPGIYVPGLGGVRIEDDVVITPDGHRSLTSFSRDLMTVG